MKWYVWAGLGVAAYWLFFRRSDQDILNARDVVSHPEIAPNVISKANQYQTARVEARLADLGLSTQTLNPLYSMGSEFHNPDLNTKLQSDVNVTKGDMESIAKQMMRRGLSWVLANQESPKTIATTQRLYDVGFVRPDGTLNLSLLDDSSGVF